MDRICKKNYGIDKIIVGGESAGAHLAAVTTIRLRQRHGYKFAGSKLTYGLYDFTNWLPSREIVDGKNMMQDSKSCELYANLFIPNPKKRKNPDVSPLYADLDDMPRHYLQWEIQILFWTTPCSWPTDGLLRGTRQI